MKTIHVFELTNDDSLFTILRYEPDLIPLGLESNSVHLSVVLSPNPTPGPLLLQGENLQIGDRVCFYTLEHVLVKEITLTGSKTQMDIGMLHQGLYFCEIFRGEERIALKRFLKE